MSDATRQAPATLVGLDCAVDPRRRGVARGTLCAGGLHVDLAARGDRCDLGALVRAAAAAGPVLLALDAPLGWPAALGRTLAGHRAGQPLAPEADTLFRRETDRLVAARLGKTPLDVGADRIARTARAALAELDLVAHALGRRRPIPLLWRLDRAPAVAAVEVYPAGLLVASGCPVRSGYKSARDVERRRRILAHLAGELSFTRAARAAALADADLLDAALCVLAAADVLGGRAVGPRTLLQRDLARQEGWIWVRDETQTGSPDGDPA
jgi:hypothetical protein